MVLLTDALPDAPDNTSTASASRRTDDLSNYLFRQLLGWIGLLLPAFLIFLVWWRDGLQVWDRLESVSAYYYTGSVAAFVGMLVAFALFLLVYRGYNNRYHKVDVWAARTGGVAALGIALFPTREPDGMARLTWWDPWIGVVHHVSAIVLFGIFALFCLWLFRATDGAVRVDDGKKWRNRIYLACGLVILCCIIWAVANGRKGDSIFVPESIALIAFALSWLVKGYFHRSILGAARSLVGKS